MIEQLPPRERQVFEAVCRLGRASAVDVAKALSDAPSNSAVRAMLSRLEIKGYLTHAAEGHRYVYSPSVSRAAARTSALDHIVQTFFDGSPAGAALALLGRPERLDPADLDALETLIEQARRKAST